MTESRGELAIAVGLAGVAGVLHGVGPGIPLLVDAPTPSLELTPEEIGPITSLVNLLSTAVTIGIFLAGYWWAGGANIPAAYGRFSIMLYGAAFVGLSLGYLPLFLLVSRQPLVAVLGLFGVLAVSLLAIPVSGLAGGAIAEYRSVTDTIWR